MNRFIAPSRFLQEKVQEHGVKTPIACLPNFIHVDQFEPQYDAEPYFVFAGRLVAVKGVKTLIEAMRHVRNAKLYIAGTGELEDDLRQTITKHQLDHVELLGHLNKDELTTLVQQATAMLVPSEWYENCPMSVLESFAWGTPVIGTRIGGIPELVRDGCTGLLFEPGNAAQLAEAMQSMLAQPAKRWQMAQEARHQVERNHNPAAHYEDTINLYQSLIVDRIRAHWMNCSESLFFLFGMGRK